MVTINHEPSPYYTPDNVLHKFGSDGDGAFWLNSAVLAQNTAPANGGLVGTPVTQASPTNTLFISNVTTNGDIVLAVNNGGNSVEFLRLDASAQQIQFFRDSAISRQTWGAGAYIGLQFSNDLELGFVGSTDAYHPCIDIRISGDTYGRFGIEARGLLAWGPGNAAGDIDLARAGAGRLYTAAVANGATTAFEIQETSGTAVGNGNDAAHLNVYGVSKGNDQEYLRIRSLQTSQYEIGAVQAASGSLRAIVFKQGSTEALRINTDGTIRVPGSATLGTDGAGALQFGATARFYQSAFDTWDVTLESMSVAQPFTRLRIAPLSAAGGGDLSELSLDASTIANVHAGNFGRLFMEAASTRFYVGQEKRGTFTALPFQWQVVGRLVDATGEDNVFSVLPGDSTHAPFLRVGAPLSIGTGTSSANTGVVAYHTLTLDETYADIGANDTYGASVTTRTSAITGNSNQSVFGTLSRVIVPAANNKNWTYALALQAVRGEIETLASSTGVIAGAAHFIAPDATIGGATLTNQYGLYVGALTTATNNYGIYINTPTGTIAEAIHIAGGNVNLGAGSNVVLATSTGTKIGTATNQLMAFWNATPVDQPATVTDAATQSLTGVGTVDQTKLEADLTSCKNAINTLIDRLQELGLVA